MAAKHNFQHPRLALRTNLPADQLVRLVAEAGAAVANKLPGQARDEIVNRYPMGVEFAVKSRLAAAVR